MEARNYFYRGVGVGTLKCTHRFNHYGKRGNMFNKGMISIKCPRCNEIEDWNHVVQCEAMLDME